MYVYVCHSPYNAYDVAAKKADFAILKEGQQKGTEFVDARVNRAHVTWH